MIEALTGQGINVRHACRTLGVSEAGFYAWRSRPTRQQARTAIYDYIEGWYNPRRRHSALGYLSPAQFEAQHHQGAESAA